MSDIKIRKSPHGVLECEHYAREFAVHIIEYFHACVEELIQAERNEGVDDTDTDWASDLVERAFAINDHVLFDLLTNNAAAMKKIAESRQAIRSLTDALGLAGDAKIATGDNYHAITIL